MDSKSENGGVVRNENNFFFEHNQSEHIQKSINVKYVENRKSPILNEMEQARLWAEV